MSRSSRKKALAKRKQAYLKRVREWKKNHPEEASQPHGADYFNDLAKLGLYKESDKKEARKMIAIMDANNRCLAEK